MIALIQRVKSAAVSVAGREVASINAGLLAFIAVERGDTEQKAQRLVERIAGYRVFADEAGKMNLNVQQAGGALLLVSQFTLAADTDKGMRPSFTPAAAPLDGERLFNHLVGAARDLSLDVATGVFGADMQVALINDGPVTFLLRA